MKCVVSNANLKVWGKALQTLISTGDDSIHFKFTNSRVTITTFDSSLAVCGSCAFERQFFMSYDTPSENLLPCRVPAKCLLKAFRSLRFLTKFVTTCEINLEHSRDTMEIILETKWGPVIQYSIRFAVETEAIMELDCSIETLANWIKVEPKLILGTISNFGPSVKVADLTIKTADNKVLLKNCSTDVVKREGKIYTELSVNSVDFAEYAIREDCEITVPLREFKMFVAFAEGLKLSLSIHFQNAEHPVVIVFQNELYKATLTLATRFMIAANSSQQLVSQGVSAAISNVTSNTPNTNVIARPPTTVTNRPIVAQSSHRQTENQLDRRQDSHLSNVSSNNSNMVRDRHPTPFRAPESRTRKSNERHSSVVHPEFDAVENELSNERSNSILRNATFVRDETAPRSIRCPSEMNGSTSPSTLGNPNISLNENIDVEMEEQHRSLSLSLLDNNNSDSMLAHMMDDFDDPGLEDPLPISVAVGSGKRRKTDGPTKKFKTIDSIFPDLGTRFSAFTIPGMDVVLLPDSDEEQ